MYGELGRYPLHINRFVLIIKYLGKLIQSGNVLIKCLYNDMFIACKNGVKNWSYNVNDFLDNYLNHYNTFYLEFKSRLIDTFQQQ